MSVLGSIGRGIGTVLSVSFGLLLAAKSCMDITGPSQSERWRQQEQEHLKTMEQFRKNEADREKRRLEQDRTQRPFNLRRELPSYDPPIRLRPPAAPIEEIPPPAPIAERPFEPLEK